MYQRVGFLNYVKSSPAHRLKDMDYRKMERMLEGKTVIKNAVYPHTVLYTLRVITYIYTH